MTTDQASTTGVHGRYAAALYDLAEEARAIDQVRGELNALAALIKASPDFERLVRAPLYTREEQAKGLSAIAGRMGVSALTQRFLMVLVQNRRLFALDGVAAAFAALIARRRGEITAEVTSAAPLSDAQVATLKATLKDALGREPALDLSVDPALIGGLIVRAGSRMIDSSLRTKLKNLELAMKGA